MRESSFWKQHTEKKNVIYECKLKLHKEEYISSTDKQKALKNEHKPMFKIWTWIKIKKICAINSFEAWFYKFVLCFNVDAHLLL